MSTTKNIENAEKLRTGMIAACYCCMPLYLIFWIADWFYAGEYIYHFLVARIFMVITCFIYLKHVTKNRKDYYSLQRVVFSFVIINALILNYITFFTGGFESSYYAGLNLFLLGCISFLPWSKIYLARVVIATYLPHYLLSSIYLFNSDLYYIFLSNYSPRNQSPIASVVVQSFFIIGSIIVSFVIRHYNDSLRIKEFEARKKLLTTIVERNQVIEKKTEEGIKLQELTRQFSPQVVHAIKNEELNLVDDVHRSKICCIFIDIVDSTSQITHISNKDMSKVIAYFMEDSMKVLLKYDITIDKFLGDGILAFSNDPLPVEDYIGRVIQAALEINKRIATRQDEYQRYWRKPFEIRTGISSGVADVGFYGYGDYFKGYTAIGRVVNLASRLCGTAKPGQILLDQKTANQVADDKYIIAPIGSLNLKGFQENQHAFEVLNSKETSISNIIPECPNGHGVLSLYNSRNGLYEFTCRTCQYRLEESTIVEQTSGLPRKTA